MSPELYKVSIDDLQKKLNNDPQLVEACKIHPAQTVAEVVREVGTPLQTDRCIYRIVVSSLGATILLCTVGAIVLENNGKGKPELLASLGVGSLGALAGLLAPSPKQE